MAAASPREKAWRLAAPSVFRMNGLVSSTVSIGWIFLHGQNCLPTTQEGLSKVMSCLDTECPHKQIRLSPLGLVISSWSTRIASSGSMPMLSRISFAVVILVLSFLCSWLSEYSRVIRVIRVISNQDPLLLTPIHARTRV